MAVHIPKNLQPDRNPQNLPARLFSTKKLIKLQICKTFPHVPILKCLIDWGQVLRNRHLGILEVKSSFRRMGASFTVKVNFNETVNELFKVGFLPFSIRVILRPSSEEMIDKFYHRGTDLGVTNSKA